jgi:hypothetical protein
MLIDADTKIRGGYICDTFDTASIILCDLKGNYIGFYNSTAKMYGNIIGMTGYGLYHTNGFYYDCTFARNAQDVSNAGNNVGYRCSLNSVTSFSWPSYSYLEKNFNHCFYDYGGEYGKIRSWTSGGYCVTEAAPATPPVTLPYAYALTTNSATYYGWMEIPILVEAGKMLRIKIYEKCSTNPSTYVVGPKFQLIKQGYLFDDANAVLVEKTAQYDGGDDTNWHTINLDYRSQYNQQLLLRVLAKKSANYFHWMYELQNNAVAVLQLRGV